MLNQPIFLRFPGGRSRALTLSYDDGVEQDERLIGLMETYGFKGTFNLGSALFAPEGMVWPEGQVHRRLPLSRIRPLYSKPFVEVAVHGARHLFLTRTPRANALWDVLSDRVELEKVFGGIVRGMAYAFGAYDDAAVDVLRACGILYARTVNSTHTFQLPNDPLRLHPTCHHNDPALNELCDTFLAPVVGRPVPRLFYLWGHAYEFEQRDNWHVIEAFMQKMAHQPDVWYATNCEIVEYVQAYDRLVFSADGETAMNPSAQPVWCALGDRPAVCIPAGETVNLVKAND